MPVAGKTPVGESPEKLNRKKGRNENMKRRFWAGLLSFVMLWSLLPASALAAEPEPEIEAETVEVQAARIKWYDRHEVRIEYFFNDASGKTKADDIKKSIASTEGAIIAFKVKESGYNHSAKVTSGNAKCSIDDLGYLHVTHVDEDSVITVTYTPKDVIYIDQYYDNGKSWVKWTGNNIKVNGPELLNGAAEAAVIEGEDLTGNMENHRFLTVNGVTYDFSFASLVPVKGTILTPITDVWYDRDEGTWYYSHTDRKGVLGLGDKVPVVNRGCVNFCYNVQHTEASAHHQFDQFVETVAPTCTEKGYTVYKCAYCEETETRDETSINPDNHEWGAWVHNGAETMEKSSHTRVCKLNASHTETKDCTFVEKDGKSVCSVCGGTYDGAPETFTVTYDANGGYCGNATESITTKEDPASYGVNDVANLSYAGEYVPQHDDVDGSNVLFLGWSTEKVPGIISFSADPETVAAYLKTTVTMDGDKTVYAVWGTDANKNGTPDVFQAKVTYKVVNGWWTDNGTTVLPNKEIVAWFNLYQKVGNTWKIATPAPKLGDTVPKGHSGQPGYTGAGWFMNDDPNEMESAPDRRTEVTKPVTLYTFKYVDASHKTDIVDTLNAIVKKEFTKANNVESGDVTFTAKATITKQPKPDIQSLPEVEPAGASHTILGTVTLSTKVGTGSFAFAHSSLDDVNPADGDYVVEVSEVNGDADNVTYDKQTFIVEITVKDGAVGKNSVQVMSSVDGKEWAPVTDGRITFKNTYTKKTTSRDDDSDTYSYVVKKVDAQDGHALKDAKFGLYVDDKQIATATSGSKGYARFSLDERVYNKLDKNDDLYVRELTAPDGYVKSSRKYDVSVNDFVKNNVIGAQEQAITVTNSRSSTPDRLNDEEHFAYVIGYKDGNVRPYGLISRAETTTIFFRLMKDSVRDGNLLTSNTYTDVADNYWANTAISTMTGLGTVQGRTATTFDPYAPITRAQFAAICARFDDGKTQGGQTFTDIQGHWAQAYIERAAELGWIKGFEDGTFRPDTYITRAQAMTMINRVLNRIPEDADDLLSNMNVWPDCNPGDWFYLAVQEATNSHDYKHKAGNYETWSSMNKDPDWTRYEN